MAFNNNNNKKNSNTDVENSELNEINNILHSIDDQ